uniref:Reverse transcriptase domain-containing protein n=1 Tax=Cannabis sativa TaxID=3483 RepID=A0A803NGN4_CANSA
MKISKSCWVRLLPDIYVLTVIAARSFPATNYLSTWFPGRPARSCNVDEFAIIRCLPRLPRYRFLHDVSNEEVRKALFQIHPDKSHAPDGMTPGFFQKYWDVVGQDIVSRVREFFNPCSLLNGLSQTNIVLISKKKHSVTIGDLRPISLCDVLHKMISKKHKGKEGYIALKLDLSKAYDRIDWSFLCTMMLKIRFDPQLVALILAIIYLVWYMVVNGGWARILIGFGRDTDILNTPLLPDDTHPYVLPTHLGLEHNKVQSLMIVDRLEWDTEVLSDLFDSRDYELILNVPLSSSNGFDNWFWAKDTLVFTL